MTKINAHLVTLLHVRNCCIEWTPSSLDPYEHNSHMAGRSETKGMHIYRFQINDCSDKQKYAFIQFTLNCGEKQITCRMLAVDQKCCVWSFIRLLLFSSVFCFVHFAFAQIDKWIMTELSNVKSVIFIWILCDRHRFRMRVNIFYYYYFWFRVNHKVHPARKSFISFWFSLAVTHRVFQTQRSSGNFWNDIDETWAKKNPLGDLEMVRIPC